MFTRPLLADTADLLSDVQLPCIGTPKLDGHRLVMLGGKALSRNLKPFRNTYIRETLECILPNGMDGEVMLRDKTIPYNEVSSALSREDGEPDFVFHVFDYVRDEANVPYTVRLHHLMEWLDKHPTQYVEIVPFTLLQTERDMELFFKQCMDNGFEGAMFRKPDGPYKSGRATLKQQILLKHKPWRDSEALIIGFLEQEKNENEKEVNELGLTKRSHKKEGKVLAGTLGKFVAVDPVFPNQQLEIGTGLGLTKELRQIIWNDQDTYLGKIVKYKYQFEGSKDKPRFPSWQGWREENDLDQDHPIIQLKRLPDYAEKALEGFLE